MPQEGYVLDRIGDSMYAVTAGGNQSAFLVAATGVVLIDTPPSLATALSAAIRKVTSKPVTHIIHTTATPTTSPMRRHSETSPESPHQDTATTIQAAQDPNRPMPTTTFGASPSRRVRHRCVPHRCVV
ncbi:hypothetical protein ACFQ1S_30700, partial [Kibdelosporangium lantanae]